MTRLCIDCKHHTFNVGHRCGKTEYGAYLQRVLRDHQENQPLAA